MQLSLPFTIPAKETPVPNAKELERQLRDFQNLLPQIVGSLLAVITAIGVIVAAVNPGGGSGSLNGEKTPTPSATAKPGNSGDYSKPEFADGKYLHTHRSSVDYMQSGVGVTFDGKDYPKSMISTSDWFQPTGYFDVDEKYSTLNYTTAWASNIPNTGGVGVVEVYLNGGLRDRVMVKPGESKVRNADIRGGGQVKIVMYALDKEDDKKEVASNGLAILTPTLK